MNAVTLALDDWQVLDLGLDRGQRDAHCSPFCKEKQNITLALNIASRAWRRTQPYRFCLDEHHFLFVRQGIRVYESRRSRAEQVGWANWVQAPMLLVIVVVAHSFPHFLSAPAPTLLSLNSLCELMGSRLIKKEADFKDFKDAIWTWQRQQSSCASHKSRAEAVPAVWQQYNKVLALKVLI